MAVKFSINHCELEAGPGPTLFDYAEQLDVRVPTSCRKQGKCRECLIEIVEGADLLTPKTAEEEHLQDPFRLSCRCGIAASEGTVTCHTMRRGAMRIEEGGESFSNREFELEPAITRDGDRILMDGKEIDRSSGSIHGIAIDLGTTTVVVRLINLETGDLVAVHSFENPQRFGGSDVMSRIHYDTENKGRLLHRTLIGYLKHTIEDFPVDADSIYEMVIAGNSTMRDLFFRLSVFTIGQKPYRSITQHEMLDGKRTTTSLTATPKRLGFPMNENARIYGLPIIGGHVGADTSACLLATDLAHEERTVVMMDLGTNTELVIGNRNRLLAASCPAGPAFEGGAISCGMPGLQGAIESVKLNGSGVKTSIIGGDEPEGICGSGLIDLLSELLRTERMNQMGRLENEETQFSLTKDEKIFLHESDINELAQAKGANVAGLNIVMKNYGVDFSELDCFYLAGSFGRNIEVDAAIRIGLIPNLPKEKIKQIGNASIEGATIALLSTTRRDELEDLVKTIEHVELETDPDFFDYFVDGCQFVALGGEDE